MRKDTLEAYHRWIMTDAQLDEALEAYTEAWTGLQKLNDPRYEMVVNDLRRKVDELYTAQMSRARQRH